MEANVIAAFNEEQVQRLTGLSTAQLRYWDRTGFFSPSSEGEDRVYLFKDVVALRIIGVLRNRSGVPLQHLRRVAKKLSHLEDALWTQTTLYVLRKKVIFHDPSTGIPQEIVSGQYVLEIPLEIIVQNTRKDAEQLKRRDASQIGRIEKRRSVLRNAPVVAGTRIPIAAVLRLSEDGYSPARIVEEYPSLTEADVEAVVRQRGSSLAA